MPQAVADAATPNVSIVNRTADASNLSNNAIPSKGKLSLGGKMVTRRVQLALMREPTLGAQSTAIWHDRDPRPYLPNRSAFGWSI